MIKGVDCQPPSGGCVLKPVFLILLKKFSTQPPSGGCVLKQDGVKWLRLLSGPAAFGRLCVETQNRREASAKDGASRLRAAVC